MGYIDLKQLIIWIFECFDLTKYRSYWHWLQWDSTLVRDWSTFYRAIISIVKLCQQNAQ